MDNDNSKIGTNLSGLHIVLLIGFGLIALSIFLAGRAISQVIPNSLHGNLHGNFHGTLTDGQTSDREFMSEWQASSFVGLSHSAFEKLVNSGELVGTYTAFAVERVVWRHQEHSFQHGGMIFTETPVQAVPTPTPVVYDIVIEYQRIFSRERLYEWLMNRIDS